MKKLRKKLTINTRKLKSSLKDMIGGSEKNLVLDVGNHTVKMLEYTFANEQIQVLKGFITYTPIGVLEDGRITNITELSELITKKMKEEHINSRRLTISIASNEIITREMTVPKIKPEDLDKFIEVNSADIFPVKLITYSLGYSIIEEYKDKGLDMSRIIIAAIPKDIIMPYINLAAALKLELRTINFSGYELYNFINFETAEKEDGYAVIDLGSKNTNLIIVSKGILKFNRVINKGSEEINKIISKNIGCNTVKAEQLKRQYNSVIILGKLKQDAEVYKVAQITQNVISDIMQDVLRVIEFYNANNSRNRITKIYITGLGSKISGIEEFVEGILGLPIIRIKEFTKVAFEGRAKRLRNRQLTLINCLGATQLNQRKFNFIKGDLQLSNFMLLFNPLFYKSVVCFILIIILIACGINFSTFLINEKTKEYNSFVSSKIAITKLQGDIEIETAKFNNYQTILTEIGNGAEKFSDELEIIENVIGEMSETVKISVKKYKLSSDSIEISCVATSLKGGNLLDDIDYMNAPYDFEEKLNQYFDCERGKNTKPEDFVLTLNIKK